VILFFFGNCPTKVCFLNLFQGTEPLWSRLIVTVDTFGLQLTNQIKDSKKIIHTANVAMRLDKVNNQNQV